MREPLTARQAEVQEFVRAYLRERGYPPGVADVQRHFGWRSKNAAHLHLRALEAKGRIALDGARRHGFRDARAIRVLPAADELPLADAGRLAAQFATPREWDAVCRAMEEAADGL